MLHFRRCQQFKCLNRTRFKSSVNKSDQHFTETTSEPPLLIFDTYKMVRHFENSGQLNRQQSTALMQSLQGVLSQELVQKASQEMVSKNQAHNETVYYKAALNDMKAELAALRKTETVALEMANVKSQRELDLLALKFREDFNNLKSEITLEMNQRKHDYKEKMQKAEVDVQEIRHFMSISAGEIKTQIEAMKLELITKWLSSIAFTTAVAVFVMFKI